MANKKRIFLDMHTIKNHLQSIVAAKIPDAFVAKTSEIVDVTATGIPQVDALIQGFPHGALTEIYGLASSGRTTLALSFLAEMTRQQQVCTIVDTSDSFDPESLAAAGALLNRVLWVRCGNADTSEDLASACTSASLPDSRQEAFHRLQGLTSGRHPRDEVRGLSQAISGLMKNNFSKPPGANTFGKMTRPIAEVRSREEQVAIDRRPPRRGDEALARRHARGKTIPSRIHTHLLPRYPLDKRQNPWSRLEQALKVTDLILHNGGFGAVLMDLGDVPPLNARRIPLATWFRFRRAVDNTPTVFLLLTREPCAQTCASLVLRCQHCRERWSQASALNGSSEMVVTLEGLDLKVEVMRRQALQPRSSHAVNAANWQTRMNWSEA
jgi:recombination protein RecA